MTFSILAFILSNLWIATADTHRSSAALGLAYTIELWSPLSGARPHLAWRDKVDVMLTLRLSPQTTVFLYGLGTQGKSLSESLGVVQTLSNIEAPASWRLYEAFVEYLAAAKRLSVLAGLYDLSSEFDVLSTAGLFLNSSFGTGPELAQSRPQGPSIFPITSLGIRLRTIFTPRVYGQLAVLDGVPGDPRHPAGTHIRFGANDGLLLVAEVGFHPKHLTDPAWHLTSRLTEVDDAPKVAFGLWYYTARFERLDAGRQRGNAGAYVLGEARLTEKMPQAVWFFLRIGIADPRVNRFAYYTGGGLSAKGWIRPEDHMGIGLAAVHHSPHYNLSQGKTNATEWVVEGTYLWHLSARLHLQFDLQWVHQPDTLPGSLLAGGVRLLWHP